MRLSTSVLLMKGFARACKLPTADAGNARISAWRLPARLHASQLVRARKNIHSGAGDGGLPRGWHVSGGRGPVPADEVGVAPKNSSGVSEVRNGSVEDGRRSSDAQ